MLKYQILRTHSGEVNVSYLTSNTRLIIGIRFATLLRSLPKREYQLELQGKPKSNYFLLVKKLPNNQEASGKK